MKIPGFDITGVASRHSLLPSHPDSSQHMAWRRALEQAQWEQKGRHQPAPQSDARDGHTTAGVDTQAGPARLAPEALSPAESRMPVGSASDPMAGANARSALANATLDSRRIATPTENGRAQSVSVPPAVGSQLPRSDVQLREARRSGAPGVATELLGERPQWMPTALVIHVQGQQVRATLRDANLDAPQAARLFRDLRAHLARAGMQLMELMVNGQPVQPDFPGLPAHDGRQHGS